ncbi:MAG: alcohol dehydrogenase catalytic domain-containing protein [Candidatus Dojkabacteria bacterium]
MKALQYLGPKHLEFIEIPKPKIKSDEILMKTKKVGICGTDLHIYSGAMDLKTPLIPGHEFVGDVAEVGSDVQNFKIGDRIVAEHVIGCGVCAYCKEGRKNLCENPTIIGLNKQGAFAEYVALPADLVYKLPDSVDYDHGVLVEPLSVALYGVIKSGVGIGDKALVIGQGPIGIFLDQVLLSTGAEVYAADIVDNRLKFVKENNFVIESFNSKDSDFIMNFKKAVGNLGVDFVFEAVGIEATAELAINTVKSGGKVMFLGVFEHKVNLSLMKVVRNEIDISGSWTSLNTFGPTIELLENKKITTDKFITHRYKFEDAIKAFEDSAEYSDNRIKTIIEFS